MQSIGQSSSAEVNIVGILRSLLPADMMIFCCPLPVFAPSASPASESLIIENQNKKEVFLLWDDFLSNQKACHSFSCTYLWKFIDAELSEILSSITLSYLKKCEQWQWPLLAVVEHSSRKQKLRLHPSTPTISGARKTSCSLFLVSASASVKLLSFMFSKIRYLELLSKTSTADFTNLVILGLSKFC